MHPNVSLRAIWWFSWSPRWLCGCSLLTEHLDIHGFDNAVVSYDTSEDVCAAPPMICFPECNSLFIAPACGLCESCNFVVHFPSAGWYLPCLYGKPFDNCCQFGVVLESTLNLLVIKSLRLPYALHCMFRRAKSISFVARAVCQMIGCVNIVGFRNAVFRLFSPLRCHQAIQWLARLFYNSLEWVACVSSLCFL